jgi:glycosyltransferase involved in cell wall biosynthesis
MKPPKISVVIPSYNKAKYISQTLESIFKQDYGNIEVIVQDGGSTDGTVGIVRKFINKYPKKTIFDSKKDNGQCDAINRGFAKATGDILTFINADDIYEPYCFDNISKTYLNNKDALWFAGFGRMIDEKGHEIASVWSNIKNLLLVFNSYSLLILTSNYLFQPSVFITREAYKKFGPFENVEKYIFEYEMWLKLGMVSMPIVVKKYLSSFRISKNNMSSVYYYKLFEKDINVIKKYSNSGFVVFLHKLNNLARLISIKVINK